MNKDVIIIHCTLFFRKKRSGVCGFPVLPICVLIFGEVFVRFPRSSVVMRVMAQCTTCILIFIEDITVWESLFLAWEYSFLGTKFERNLGEIPGDHVYKKPQYTFYFYKKLLLHSFL